MYIPPVPQWMQTIFFNYCQREIIDEIPEPGDGASKVISTRDYRYVAYNKRHNPVMQLFIYTANSLVNGQSLGSFRGTLIFNPWSWDADQTVKENRLGIRRSGNYAFENDMTGEIKIEFSSPDNRPGPVFGTSFEINVAKETYYLFDEYGKRTRDIVLERAATGQSISIGFLTSILDTCLISDTNPVFPAQVKQWDIGFPLFGTPYTAVEEHIYTQLSAQVHTVYVERKATANSAEQLEGTVDSLTRVLAPIPRRQRVQTLDTGQWAEISLEEAPAAAMARYYGIPFNNSYANLANQDDTGIQQILAAADADFVKEWSDVQPLINFNDIRALQSTLLSYVSILSAYTCRELGIRYQYLDYVAAVITYKESMRGITTNKSYGVHNYYPWFNQIAAKYQGFLEDVFDIFSVELSANDTPAFLVSSYKSGVMIYNPWMGGITTEVGYNIARLGADISRNIRSYLTKVQAFRERYWWAGIDRALTEAYTSDSAFGGSITINDPAVIVKPGDSVRIDFLDSVQDLKVVGVDMNVDPESLVYAAQVKKQW